MPIQPSHACTSLAWSAKENGIFLKESDAKDKSKITIGSLFLNREGQNEWHHTGIVIQVENDFFLSIEGNANHEGGSLGYEVCKKYRGYKNRDFVII
ncbi:MAG: hypothetical protein JW984_11085 [Deltaproteobacteria bacterium]|uniref:CHAP domain-containing protein n=1 Tax=Candidatus Zymogenus saltonus TaxID=2844893 RepID=A0A9D8KFW3_9DELT|nr:hypothetical protein [Candidatus Zymogenus saltonus]